MKARKIGKGKDQEPPVYLLKGENAQKREHWFGESVEIGKGGEQARPVDLLKKPTKRGENSKCGGSAKRLKNGQGKEQGRPVDLLKNAQNDERMKRALGGSAKRGKSNSKDPQ